ncbi:hypothetical protein HU751_009185 [Pseudomonas sp. BW13M1]|uniref:Putative tail fiber protein gp53-like C-terminal domain-containing protein n=1 Tax=Pseudomonas peradeniyensis TaxID=2745488 RepID=A0A923GA65_9PSED|nr:hypothetical protein [Pseudomonas peradeniyensis]MBV4505024.1 hypothetical protein [Pseudomonas peradeniyensis]
MSRADILAVNDKAVQDFVIDGEVSEAEITAGAAQGRKWFSLRRLQWGLLYSLGTNGYVRLPWWLAGLIFQWGYINKPSAAMVPVSWPMAFTRGFGRCVAVFGGSGNPNAPISVGSPSLTGANLYSSYGGEGVDVSYWVVGW